MGCDIHMYVEFQSAKKDYKYWESFGGRINPGRNYVLFGKIAGVRGGRELFAPRGLPKDLGFYSQEDSRFFIVDEPDESGEYVTLEQAKKYEQYGSTIIEQNGKPTWVTHPDWHGHTWLTPDELSECYVAAVDQLNREWGPGSDLCDEYHALLAAMRCLESRNNSVRVVIWFDN